MLRLPFLGLSFVFFSFKNFLFFVFFVKKCVLSFDLNKNKEIDLTEFLCDVVSYPQNFLINDKKFRFFFCFCIEHSNVRNEAIKLVPTKILRLFTFSAVYRLILYTVVCFHFSSHTESLHFPTR